VSSEVYLRPHHCEKTRSGTFFSTRWEHPSNARASYTAFYDSASAMAFYKITAEALPQACTTCATPAAHCLDCWLAQGKDA
jgi:hypothetical protein